MINDMWIIWIASVLWTMPFWITQRFWTLSFPRCPPSRLEWISWRIHAQAGRMLSMMLLQRRIMPSGEVFKVLSRRYRIISIAISRITPHHHPLVRDHRVGTPSSGPHRHLVMVLLPHCLPLLDLAPELMAPELLAMGLHPPADVTQHDLRMWSIGGPMKNDMIRMPHMQPPTPRTLEPPP
jgi:hypothetical protein